MMNDKTRIGVFCNQEWQYNMYIAFFEEIINKTGEIISMIKSKDYCAIVSEIYYVKIFLGTNISRGHKYDVVFCGINEEEYDNSYLLPVLNMSKFLRKDE